MPINQLTKEKQTHKIRVTEGKGINQKVWINRSTIMQIKQVINKDLLQSEWGLCNTVTTYMRKESKDEDIHTEPKKIPYTNRKCKILQ